VIGLSSSTTYATRDHRHLKPLRTLHTERNIPVPAPTPLEQLAVNPEYQGGVWLLVDIDLAKLKVKANRVNITLSENLLHEIDRYAVRYHMTRSGLLAQTAGQYIHRKEAA
jgi:hypothetical protein